MSLRALLFGIMLMVLLMIPSGYIGVSIQSYYLSLHGTSFESGDIGRVFEILREYQYHSYMIGYYFLSAVVVVAIPSYVAGLGSKEKRIHSGLLIGILAVMLFVIFGNVKEDLLFSLFQITILVASSLFGAYMSTLRGMGR